MAILVLKMKLSTKHQLFNYLILISAIGNFVKEGKAHFIQVPPSPLYTPIGKTARFIWDYTVDNRTAEFQLQSPVWNYYYANGTAVNIGYEHFLLNWSWIINSGTCPTRLLNPTIRVSKESNATLVIANVTTNDSGIYDIVLMWKTARPITSKVQLLVTTRPKFTSQFQASIIVLESRGLRLRCTATGIPTPNITWVLLKDQTKEIKSQSEGYADLIMQNITRHQNGTYQCQATNNPNEYPVENQTEVIIWYKPNITFLNWTVDEKIILLCLASGQPHPLIKWYYPSGIQVESGITDITGGSRIVLEIPDRNAGLYGVYKCNATNEVGWQVGYINITQINRPTSKTVTERAVTVTSKRNMKTKASSAAITKTRTYSKPSMTTPVLDKKATTVKIGPETPKYKITLNNVVLLCVLGVVLPIIVTVSVIILLRKRCQQRINKEIRADADDDNNARPHTVLPEASTIVTYAEVKNIPIYAQVNKSKKRTNRQSDNMPIYAQVDKTKKRRPGQIIYAELEDITSRAETSCIVLPPSYNAAEYAEIKNVHNRQPVSNPEPIYETLPGYS